MKPTPLGQTYPSKVNQRETQNKSNLQTASIIVKVT